MREFGERESQMPPVMSRPRPSLLAIILTLQGLTTACLRNSGLLCPVLPRRSLAPTIVGAEHRERALTSLALMAKALGFGNRASG